MCSKKPDVDHLVRTETAEGIGYIEIDEWSGLLTNEQEIAVNQNSPRSFIITDSAKRANGKPKRNEVTNPSWTNKNIPKNKVDKKQQQQKNSNDYYIMRKVGTTCKAHFISGLT